ncbi:hypothetical protein [uncultured Thioclava sp.]|uniref:hypothetical protein n=1 Tax=uncultured Thioclava sp. TaxID=473858 RepID=UPI0025E67C8D|nr:hypothetical protein [uncultured Thioclava sp.]
MSQLPYSRQALRAVFLHSKALSNCRRMLLVDPVRELPIALHGIEGLSLNVVQFESISSELLADIAPEMVLAPLLSVRFDILDLARLLTDLGYQGAVRAYCAPVPNAKVICTEVKSEFPKLDFHIFEVPPGSERDH